MCPRVSCANREIEVEDLKVSMCSEELGRDVQPGMWRAPEVREAKRAQFRPATTEKHVIDNRAEEVR